jgi:putative nucleotidyltransferase with HDIG domain
MQETLTQERRTDVALDRTHPATQRAPEPVHRSAGRRLLEAFEAFERFPAFAPARGELLEAASKGTVGADIVAAVESDLALTVAVLRRANRAPVPMPAVATIPEALERVGPRELRALVTRAPSFDFFEQCRMWGRAPQVHRLHAIATQRAAGRVARATGYDRSDELLVAALLHDVGKLVLAYADHRYADLPSAGNVTPERRVARERREMGVDHALVGGVLARRWGLPQTLAHAIERHHQPNETGLAGRVRLADMIARFEAGNPIDEAAMLAAATNVGLDDAALRALLSSAPTQERRSLVASPLTRSEHRILTELAKGLLYKEIAATLGLSASTVRSHLHNTYQKLGVSDRAQAILLAKKHSWI